MSDRPTCCLVIGHRPGSQGARSITGVSEYAFNDSLAVQIEAATRDVDVELVYRDDDEGGYDRLPDQINAKEPDFIVSLHFNAHTSARASGSEVLFWHGSAEGEKLAVMCLGEIIEALRLPSRGVKPRRPGERGAHLLQHTAAPCIIAEPFFGTNPHDWNSAVERVGSLICAYALTIEKYAQTIPAPA